ncbi:sigma-54 dependent transcriptional regulator [Piscinibacter terrae]|uniref:Sigma-54-dependent Fis family transcriptional regulator n=1 Tax=Piscinibacter terrae TaxID=2496871 RepID=A0A3N7HHE2_9BURK|nr:sigma-54 dependent transcriptional regulator [Albitalea terrae]RQP21428.1 sigma-54-dependent Fis family transcriptional regulator [Albitalea terrae]
MLKTEIPHALAAPAALDVSVCASDALADLGHTLCAVLRAFEGASLSVSSGSLKMKPSACDLLIQVVSEACVPAALEQLLRQRAGQPGCAVLVVAVDLPASSLDELLAAGACDFLRAPVATGELATRVRRALGLAQERASLNPRPIHPALRDLIGDSPAFAQQVARVPVLARYDASVLILGDTGTGKEVCAQAIHYLSARAGGPWVAVNCGAIPTELVEAELFGHVKGAYTHAHSSRAGLVREAEGGTLFLDEIDSLPYGAQAKLLRFLQEKEYRPVGSNQVTHADVRVIAATNRNPAQLTARGNFRQDLLFRLNVLTLHLPLLRERQSDIPALALFFLRSAARQWQKAAPGLSPAALKKLVAYDWPGNVRELKNVMERAVLMSSSGQLSAQDIDFDGSCASIDAVPVSEESFRAAKARVVENFERSYIEHLLASNAGNVTHAARAAKKNRRAFFELMRKYKIESDAYREAV